MCSSNAMARTVSSFRLTTKDHTFELRENDEIRFGEVYGQVPFMHIKINNYKYCESDVYTVVRLWRIKNCFNCLIRIRSPHNSKNTSVQNSSRYLVAIDQTFFWAEVAAGYTQNLIGSEESILHFLIYTSITLYVKGLVCG